MTLQTGLEPLQGTWRFVKIEVDGDRLDLNEGNAKTVTIEGDEWVSDSLPHRVMTRTRFALDPARHRLDFLIAPGLTTPGIYSVDGRLLQLCMNQRPLKKALGRPIDGDDQAAPTMFAAPLASGYRLWVLERTS